MPLQRRTHGHRRAIEKIRGEPRSALQGYPSGVPSAEPYRKQGYGLAIQTLASVLENITIGIGLSEIITACKELDANEITQTRNGIFVYPTALGERLIRLLTSNEAPEPRAPNPPPPPK